MKYFITKWNSNKKIKTSIQLTLYTIFVVIVAIFAISNSSVVPVDENETQDNKQNTQNNETTNVIVETPIEYKYSIKININENEYEYTGHKTNEREIITKKYEDNTIKYIYENNNYYQDIDEEYILTSKEDVYDIVNYNYISLKTINEYLSKSEKIGNQYLVYLKDIILGSDSEDYILININNNRISIDYTVLMKYFDTSIEQYMVKIEIE